MENSFKRMGYTNWDEFFEKVMNHAGFQEDVVHASFLEKVQAHCGELAEDQVYIATPYPCVGGSGAPETYQKGDVWVYLSISAQTMAQI